MPLSLLIMKEEIDKHTGQRWIRLNDDEIKTGFLSQCIEAAAEAENSDYVEMLTRMEKADMTEGYILACYDVLHTQSWDNIITDLVELLHKRESQK